MFNKKSYHDGFSLIELVIVVSLIGVLAAIAFPGFIDVGHDAELAAINSIAGGLSSANSENYAARIERATNGNAVTNCTSVGNLLMNGIPTGYSIISLSVAVNATKTCTLHGPASTSATFNATGIN